MSFVFAPGDLEFVASECCSFLSQARGAVSKKHECNRVTHPEISPNSLVSANVESKLVLTKKLGMKLPKFSPTPKTLGVDDLEPGGGGDWPFPCASNYPVGFFGQRSCEIVLDLLVCGSLPCFPFSPFSLALPLSASTSLPAAACQSQRYLKAHQKIEIQKK